MMYVLQLFLLWFFLTFMEIIAVMFFFFFTWCHEIHIFWLHILNTIREVQDKGEHVVALKCSRQYQTHQPEAGFFADFYSCRMYLVFDISEFHNFLY